MQSIDNQQIIFLFDKSAPYVTIGRDELQTEGGIKVTIGDGGLFAREPRPILYTDYGYGNSQSRFAFVNTQFGAFYPSQRQGRIFAYSGKLDEVSRNGIHWWLKENMPSKLLENFPNYKHKDNSVIGVGLISVFDNNNEKYYICKKDYSVKTKYKNLVKYNEKSDTFEIDGNIINLKNEEYFENASWTLSYSPKDKMFISWHDWHPDWTIQGETHFMTVKDNAIWKHNQRCDSFCNFYDQDYPWSLEYVVTNGVNNQILSAVTYNMEVGKYYSECRDFHHILDTNFDYAVIHNSEQISGNLKLVLAPKNKMSQLLDKPTIGDQEFIIKYNKEEQYYRINQFDDIVKDRGEFTKNNYPIWLTESNGYIKNINPVAVNYYKSQFQKKKFRHLQHKVLLTKNKSGEHKYIFKFAINKETQSPR
jgi:hypothetical protein